MILMAISGFIILSVRYSGFRYSEVSVFLDLMTQRSTHAENGLNVPDMICRGPCSSWCGETYMQGSSISVCHESKCLANNLPLFRVNVLEYVVF